MLIVFVYQENLFSCEKNFKRGKNKEKRANKKQWVECQIVKSINCNVKLKLFDDSSYQFKTT